VGETSTNNTKSPEELIYLLDLKPGGKCYELIARVAKRRAFFEEKKDLHISEVLAYTRKYLKAGEMHV